MNIYFVFILFSLFNSNNQDCYNYISNYLEYNNIYNKLYGKMVVDDSKIINRREKMVKLPSFSNMNTNSLNNKYPNIDKIIHNCGIYGVDLGNIPFYLIYFSDINKLDYLIDKGLILDDAVNSEFSAIEWSIILDDLKSFKFFINKSKNIQEHYLFYSYLFKSENIFLALLKEKEIKVNTKNYLLLDEIIKDDSLEYFKYLFSQYKLDILNPLDRGKTILMFATENGSVKIVNLLIKSNIELNTIDNDGNTALDYAFQYDPCLHLKKREIITELLNAGAKRGSKKISEKDILDLKEKRKTCGFK